MGLELELNNEFEFEKELLKSIHLLDGWLDDELKRQPEQLRDAIITGCKNLSINY